MKNLFSAQWRGEICVGTKPSGLLKCAPSLVQWRIFSNSPTHSDLTLMIPYTNFGALFNLLKAKIPAYVPIHYSVQCMILDSDQKGMNKYMQMQPWYLNFCAYWILVLVLVNQHAVNKREVASCMFLLLRVFCWSVVLTMMFCVMYPSVAIHTNASASTSDSSDLMLLQ